MKFKCGEIYVDRLSGPISMYCLIPIKKDLPFVLLFGDDHTNSMYQCDSCTCDNDVKDCCMTFYESDFLKLLNKAVENNNSTIDINVESMDKQTDQNMMKSNLSIFKTFQTNILYQLNSDVPSGITKLAYRFKGCFYTLIKKADPSLYNEICEAPNLKWYHNDIRQIDSFDENETKRLESLISNCWSDDLFGVLFFFKIHDFTKENLDTLVLNNTLFINCKGKENVIMLCEMLEQFYSLNKINVFFNLLFSRQSLKSFIVEMIPEDQKENMKHFILKILKDLVLPLLYSRINNDKRNNMKIDENDFETFNDFIKNINKVFVSFSLLFLLLKEYIIDPSEKNFFILQEKFISLLKEINEAELRYILALKASSNDASKVLDMANIVPFYNNLSLKDVHILHSSFFLDIVNLLRITKTKSKLSIYYCGQEHCTILNEMLIRYYRYQQRVRIDPEYQNDSKLKINRCINLKVIENKTFPEAFDIDIDKILAS